MKDNILKSLHWLAGQWEGIQNSGVYHEEWELKIGGTSRVYFPKSD
ncbi:MAG: hypothetical protein JNJ56_10105 [Ignavibacteria bacterium]|nr:hypothetical protein [Ignavibacteria bacterium]